VGERLSRVTGLEQDNPFFHRGPIHDPRYFFGRQREVRQILSLLANMQNVSVAGPPRIGKTSLLLHLGHSASNLEKRMPDGSRVVFVYVSLEGLTDLRPTAFFAHLLRETYRQGQGIPALAGRSVPGHEITFLQFNEVLEGLAEAGLKLVWLLDEFDLAGANPTFDLNFFSALRHVASRGSNAFVTASDRSLYEVEAARTVGSPFADLFTTIWLGPLQSKDAANLITGLSKKGGAPLEGEVEYILDRTGCWPLFVQMLSALLFDEQRRSATLSEEARQRAEQEFRNQAAPHLEHTWSRLSQEQQCAMLGAHASGNPGDADEVEELLRLHLLKRTGTGAAPSGLIADWLARHARSEREEPPAAALSARARAPGTITVQECVRCLVKAIETKDPKLRLHCDGTARWALAVGQQLGLDAWELEGLKAAARLHDVGMLGISDVILQKPARLTAQEREIVQAHPLLGVHILEAVELPWPIRPAVRGHHERMDGSGYPDGLIGEEIPLWARILAVAETIDFMMSNKPWRKAENITRIVEELRSQAGTKYDSQVVDAILGITQSVEGR